MKTQMNLTADCCKKLSLTTTTNSINTLEISEDCILIKSETVTLKIEHDLLLLDLPNDSMEFAVSDEEDFVSFSTLHHVKKTTPTDITYIIETDEILFVLVLKNDFEVCDLPIIDLTVVIK